MPWLRFEELAPNFMLNGWFAAYQATPPGVEFSPDPNEWLDRINVVQTNQDWEVRIQWRQSGNLCNAMAGTWKVKLYLEQMGLGEFDLGVAGEATQNFVAADPHIYAPPNPAPIKIAAGVVPVGVYRLVLTINLAGPQGWPCPITAYGDGGLIQVYQAGL
jgi:hypothetical protein